MLCIICLDIIDDIKSECNKYGNVKSIEIPRPIQGIEVPGVGKVGVDRSNLFDSVDLTFLLTLF